MNFIKKYFHPYPCKIVNTAADGNCFFDCIRQATRDNISIQQQRQWVANKFTPGNYKNIKSVLESWWILSNEAKQRGDLYDYRVYYGFMIPVVPLLSSTDTIVRALEILRETIMEPSFFAEDFSIQTVCNHLSEQYNRPVRIIILSINSNHTALQTTSIFSKEKEHDLSDSIWIFLYYSGCHYELIQIHEHVIFLQSHLKLMYK